MDSSMCEVVGGLWGCVCGLWGFVVGGVLVSGSDLSWATANPTPDGYNLRDVALLCQAKLREKTGLPKATNQSYSVELDFTTCHVA